jgi:hypothetical protein
MKRFLRYVLPLVAIFGLTATLSALAGVTPSSVVSLRSPTPVLNGPVLSGRILNIGEATTIVPSSGAGVQRPVGSFLYDRAGALGYIKTGSAATAWESLGPGSIGGGANAQGAALARASLVSGISPSLLTCFREDWGPTAAAGYADALVGSGAVATSATTSDVGGILSQTTGATASSRARRHVPAFLFPRPDTGRFYLAVRVSVPTAVDAATIAEVGVFDNGGTNTIAAGICGSTSTTNYVVNYDGLGGSCAGTRVSTGVLINAQQHEWEIWGVGDGKIHFALDLSEVVGSPFTMATPGTLSNRPMFDVQNGTTAAARTQNLDWWLGCWSQT